MRTIVLFHLHLSGFLFVYQSYSRMTTLKSGIDVVPGINVAPETFGTNNKGSLLNIPK